MNPASPAYRTYFTRRDDARCTPRWSADRPSTHRPCRHAGHRGSTPLPLDVL